MNCSPQSVERSPQSFALELVRRVFAGGGKGPHGVGPVVVGEAGPLHAASESGDLAQLRTYSVAEYVFVEAAEQSLVHYQLDVLGFVERLFLDYGYSHHIQVVVSDYAYVEGDFLSVVDPSPPLACVAHYGV